MYQAGTLSGNPLAMTAGIVTLDALTAPGVFEDLALGWLLTTAGVWLATSAPGTPLLWAGVALGAVGAILVLWAFVVRYRQVRG